MSSGDPPFPSPPTPTSPSSGKSAPSVNLFSAITAILQRFHLSQEAEQQILDLLTRAPVTDVHAFLQQMDLAGALIGRFSDRSGRRLSFLKGDDNQANLIRFLGNIPHLSVALKVRVLHGLWASSRGAVAQSVSMSLLTSVHGPDLTVLKKLVGFKDRKMKFPSLVRDLNPNIQQELLTYIRTEFLQALEDNHTKEETQEDEDEESKQLDDDTPRHQQHSSFLNPFMIVSDIDDTLYTSINDFSFASGGVIYPGILALYQVLEQANAAFSSSTNHTTKDESESSSIINTSTAATEMKNATDEEDNNASKSGSKNNSSKSNDSSDNNSSGSSIMNTSTKKDDKNDKHIPDMTGSSIISTTGSLHNSSRHRTTHRHHKNLKHNMKEQKGHGNSLGVPGLLDPDGVYNNNPPPTNASHSKETINASDQTTPATPSAPAVPPIATGFAAAVTTFEMDNKTPILPGPLPSSIPPPLPPFVPSCCSHLSSRERYWAAVRAHPDWQERGNLVFLTAQPSSMGKITRHGLTRSGIDLQFTTVLQGTVWGLRSHVGMADVKLMNFLSMRDLYPEYRFVFFGDTGQGDPALAKHLSQLQAKERKAATSEYVDWLALCLLHDVRGANQAPKYDQATRDSLRKMNIIVFDTYVDAAIACYEAGLLSLPALQYVRDTALMQVKMVEWPFEKDTAQRQKQDTIRKSRIRELEQASAKVDKIAAESSVSMHVRKVDEDRVEHGDNAESERSGTKVGNTEHEVNEAKGANEAKETSNEKEHNPEKASNKKKQGDAKKGAKVEKEDSNQKAGNAGKEGNNSKKGTSAEKESNKKESNAKKQTDSEQKSKSGKGVEHEDKVGKQSSAEKNDMTEKKGKPERKRDKVDKRGAAENEDDPEHQDHDPQNEDDSEHGSENTSETISTNQ